jgi:hypothetical protein
LWPTLFEQDIGLSAYGGAMAKVRIDAYPDKVFEGRIGLCVSHPQSPKPAR